MGTREWPEEFLKISSERRAPRSADRGGLQGFFRDFLARLEDAIPMLTFMDRRSPSSPSPLRFRAAALGLTVVFALFVWFAAASSAAIDFTVAVIAAVAWCIWLDRNVGH